MRKKMLKLILAIVGLIILISLEIFFDKYSWIINIINIIIGFILTKMYSLIQDCFDTTNWKVSQRKLERGQLIKDDTIIRISFAYLYRIKVRGKYLLIKNNRGTSKYQPIGGVYKFIEHEKLNLKNKFHIQDDNKISIDESSLNDYRLQIKNKYLRKFIKYFDKNLNRENINNLSREFKEEFLDNNNDIVWNQISYRFCGRHITDIKFSQHFQIYEILLADIVELIPSKEQQKYLEELMNKDSDKYKFASDEEIKSLGVNITKKCLNENIAEHTIKILEENEDQLMQIYGVGEKYTVNIN